MKIPVIENIMKVNDNLAEENRALLKSHNVFTINILASPGAGKTSTILALDQHLRPDYTMGVIEGDIASQIDSEAIAKKGIDVLQINTGGACHLDANMIKMSLPQMPLDKIDFLFIENVGNLVCPSGFKLGEDLKMLISSVPEGADKPYKYTSMFKAVDVIVLNKIDIMPYFNFDRKVFYDGLKSINPNAPVFEISATTGEGVAELVNWLKKKK